MNYTGERIRFTLYGTERGSGAVVGLEGLPAGIALDLGAAWSRACGGEAEAGESPVPISGLRSGVTEGTPLAFVLPLKEDAQQSAALPRPGHEDLALFSLYGEPRTGGAYSGRIALALAFAGALCAQLLHRAQVSVSSLVTRMGAATGAMSDFEMKRELLDARGTGDSLGSVVRCDIHGLPAGAGMGSGGGLDSRLAGLIFAIPGVKGVEFGLGFGFAELRGSEANDQIVLMSGRAVPETNNCGGIEAGFATGQTVSLNVAVKPNPSMGREQRTVELGTLREVPLRLRGRHEPCLGVTLSPAIEGAAAICSLDALLDAGYNFDNCADEAPRDAASGAEKESE